MNLLFGPRNKILANMYKNSKTARVHINMNSILYMLSISV